MRTQIVVKEEMYKIIGACFGVHKDNGRELRQRTNRISFARKPNPFAFLAYFVVEREGGFLSNYRITNIDYMNSE